MLPAARRDSRRLAEAAGRDRFLAVPPRAPTPLTAILGYAVLVRRGKLGAAGTANALEVIRKRPLQTVLIDDLLTYPGSFRCRSGSIEPTGSGR
jgi:hypothetical protein